MRLGQNETVEDVVEESQRYEEEIFLSKIREFYEKEFEEHQQLFDYATEETRNFRDIQKEMLRDKPRVVKVLRYLVKPPISQMKLGQFAGVNTTSSYEKDSPTTPRKKTAEEIASFVEDNLDSRKVPWLTEDVDEKKAVRRCREWVCDIIAQSEAKTRYRNRRKDWQEDKVAETLRNAGLEHVRFSSSLTDENDIPAGSFARETKVVVSGGSQKADFVVRNRNENLTFIEAKAVGVRVDAYKRVKEIRNKASDWRRKYPEADVIAAVSGWIPADKIETMLDDEIEVFWEHRLEALEERFSQ